MHKIGEIFDIFNALAHPALAEDWDNAGLQIGDAQERATGIMVALDPSPEAVEEASAKGLNILFTHHPIFLTPLRSIDLGSFTGKILKAAVEKNVALFAAHTNLDSAKEGINDQLAKIIGLREVYPIAPAKASEGKTAGLGRIGAPDRTRTVKEIVQIVKQGLNIDYVRVSGDPERKIRKAAVCGGSGGSLLHEASLMGAELFISGDIRYHQAREAEALGMAVIDAGHFPTEKAALGGIAETIRKKLEEAGIGLPVEEFEGERDPLTTI